MAGWAASTVNGALQSVPPSAIRARGNGSGPLPLGAIETVLAPLVIWQRDLGHQVRFGCSAEIRHLCADPTVVCASLNTAAELPDDCPFTESCLRPGSGDNGLRGVDYSRLPRRGGGHFVVSGAIAYRQYETDRIQLARALGIALRFQMQREALVRTGLISEIELALWLRGNETRDERRNREHGSHHGILTVVILDVLPSATK